MNLKAEYIKFINHLKTGGLFYAFWRGALYFGFLIRRRMPNEKPAPGLALIKGKTKLTYEQGSLSVFYDSAEVVKGEGLVVAINTLGIWSYSTGSNQQLLERGADFISFKLNYVELPVTQVWYLKIREDRFIEWRVTMAVDSWLAIDEIRFLTMVDQSYKSWVNNYKQGDFARLGSHILDVVSEEEHTNLVGARFSLDGKALPAFILNSQEGHLYPLIQSLPVKSDARMIGFRRAESDKRKEYPAGDYQLFNGMIELYPSEPELDDKIEALRQDQLSKNMGKEPSIDRFVKPIKILSVNLPWQRKGKWGVRAGSRWPHIKDKSEGAYLPFPFFLAYATSLLRKNGIEAAAIDAVASELTEDQFIEDVLGMDFDYLVAETSVPSFSDDLKILRKLSAQGLRIILCGPNSEIYQADFLKDNEFIEFVLYGEYEFTLLELAQALRDKLDLSGVKGLIYRQERDVIKNQARPLGDINLLPWPEREDLPIYKYLDAPGGIPVPSAQMIASRGCPFKCKFCLWPQVVYGGNLYRARDIKDVVDEMEYLVRVKGFKSIYFDDDTFNVGKDRMLLICREIIARDLNKVSWAIMARPDLMDKEILDSMQKAGLRAVKYGVESAVQSLVDNIGKAMDLKKAEEMILYTKQLGIKVHLTYTFGLPGETRQTIQSTIEQVLRLDPFSAQFSITTPFPGTSYYSMLEKQDLIVEKDLSFYDGHFKSVIKLKDLSPDDLVSAKEEAYKVWEKHLRRRRGFYGDVLKFYAYTRDKGLGKAISRTRGYLSEVFLKNDDQKIS